MWLKYHGHRIVQMQGRWTQMPPDCIFYSPSDRSNRLIGKLQRNITDVIQELTYGRKLC